MNPPAINGSPSLIHHSHNSTETARVRAEIPARVLIPFVAWIGRRAVELGLTRLYFLSRDGQVLHELATRLFANLGIDMELRYLHGSRVAWHPARTREIDAFFLDYLLEAPNGLSAEMIASRLPGLEDPALTDALLRVTSASSATKLLHRADLEALREGFLKDPLRSLITPHLRQARQTTLDYFDQEGLFDATPWGLVDIGWTGKTIRCLYDLLRDQDSALPPVFFFGYHSFLIGEGNPAPETFLFSSRGKPRMNTSVMLENFCAGDHGPVLGYTADNGKLAPQLRAARNSAAIDWGLTAYRETLLARAAGETPPAPERNDSVRTDVWRTLAEFYWNPTAEQLAAWSDFPTEIEASGTERRCWAEPLPWGVAASALRHRSAPLPHRGAWPAGSVACSTGLNRQLGQLALRLCTKDSPHP